MSGMMNPGLLREVNQINLQYQHALSGRTGKAENQPRLTQSSTGWIASI